MFLLVFVTFVISILGLYAQILGVQTSKINHSQYGFMQTMLTWHEAAVSLAKPALVNLSLTPGILAPLPCAVFSDSMAFGVIPLANPPVAGCLYNGAPITLTPASLPAGYGIINYDFYSVLYQDPTTSAFFMVTYVYFTDAPGNAPSGNIQIPDSGNFTVGYSMNSLIQQFARAAPTNVNYGSISRVAGQSVLTVSAKSAGATGVGLTYTIPGVNIPPGALAIISAAY